MTDQCAICAKDVERVSRKMFWCTSCGTLKKVLREGVCDIRWPKNIYFKDKVFLDDLKHTGENNDCLTKL